MRHISVGSPTLLRSDKVADENLRDTAQKLKIVENTLAEYVTTVRNTKDNVKELDKARQDTNKKKKEKDIEKGYEKEGKLIEKVNSNLAEIQRLNEKLKTDVKILYGSGALGDSGDSSGNKILKSEFTREMTVQD